MYESQLFLKKKEEKKLDFVHIFFKSVSCYKNIEDMKQ